MKKLLLTLALTIFAFPAMAACGNSPMAINALTSGISCTTSSSSMAFTSSGECAALENTGSVGVFIKSGTSGVAATVISAAGSANETYLAAGKGIVLYHPLSDTHFACITASGTATVYAQNGNGD